MAPLHIALAGASQTTWKSSTGTVRLENLNPLMSNLLISFSVSSRNDTSFGLAAVIYKATGNTSGLGISNALNKIGHKDVEKEPLCYIGNPSMFITSRIFSSHGFAVRRSLKADSNPIWWYCPPDI